MQHVLPSILLTLLLASFSFAAEPAPVTVPANAVNILTPDSYWRWHRALRKPVYKAGAEFKPLAGQHVNPPYNALDRSDSPPPPADWDQPAFDDVDWPRSRLNWLKNLAFGRYSTAAVSLRGRFLVTDPAAVDALYLTLRFYGGAVVSLNGREVARAFLPQGTLGPDAPADLYPDDVQVNAKGDPIPGDWHRRNLPPQEKKDTDDRVARRVRTLGPVKLPLDALRKGENILAVQIRRAEYPSVAPLWFQLPNGRNDPHWIPINVADLKLQAVGSGVAPNVARPKGLQVWTEGVNDRLCVLDYGDPVEKTRPVRIVAARNGSFSGQLVLGSGQPLRAVRVAAADLKAVKGPGLIPASAVTLLYARPDVAFYGIPAWFDALEPAPRAEVPLDKSGGAVLPVLIRVAIPKDAPPGDYRGAVSVDAAGCPTVKVPLELYVADWAAPDPRNYRTYVGVYQSPTTLAMQYNVKEWSDEHWKLMDKSFALLARAGNKMVNVTVVDQTQFGNDEGMVYWIRRPDGSFAYDFAVFDRFMALAKKHFGTLDFVAIHVWHSGGWETRGADQKNTVTVIDEKTGARDHMQVPKFGTAESKKFWKPVLDAIRDRLAKLDLDKAMCLGILSDGTAPPEVFKAFDEIVPGGARWMRGLHTQNYSTAPYSLPGGGKVVLHEFCYGRNIADPDKPLPAFWNLRGMPGAAYDRISNHEMVAPLSWYRDTGLVSLMCGTKGVGRICLDFWPVLKDSRGASDIYNRYPHSSCAQREPSLKKMTWPAPDGPASTLRYEAFVEGLVYAEALIVVSEALDRRSAALGTKLADESRLVIQDLIRHNELVRWPFDPIHPYHLGWQAINRRLLDAAAKVSARAAAAP